MLPDNDGGLLVTYTLAIAVHLEQRTGDKPTQHRSNCNDARPENDAPCNLRQPAEMLKQNGSEEEGENDADSIQNTLDQEVLVVLPNEGVERLQYVVLLLHWLKNRLQKYELFSNH